MANNVSSAIDEIYQTLSGVPGLRPAPAAMPTNAAFPFAAVYPQSSVFKHAPQGVMTGLHNIVIEIHLAMATDISRAMEAVIAFSDPVANAVFKDLIDGDYTTICTNGNITSEFVYSDWNGVQTLALRFVVQEVKVQADIA
jgi:hypothetical protein